MIRDCVVYESLLVRKGRRPITFSESAIGFAILPSGSPISHLWDLPAQIQLRFAFLHRKNDFQRSIESYRR